MLYVLVIRRVELVEQFKQEPSPMCRDERHAGKCDLQDSLSDATRTDGQQPDAGSDPSKTCGGAEQPGPGYTSGYTAAKGASPNIDFHRDTAPRLETNNPYGLRFYRPFILKWGENRLCVFCVLDHRYAVTACR